MASFQETNRHNSKTAKKGRLDRGGTAKITNKAIDRPDLYEPSAYYKASIRNLKVSDDCLYQPSQSYNAATRGLPCNRKRTSMSSTGTTSSLSSTTTAESGDFFSDMLGSFPYDDDHDRYYMTQ
mmetsp:Transcript_71601/g.108150  ORF Transcript_71601/g.108150 Transcript_71601/m.108150 type:complete len:124 (-) Transcript_71601:69-440(-)